jgi:uncharacterized protein YjbI with pentapeptide repeats
MRLFAAITLIIFSSALYAQDNPEIDTDKYVVVPFNLGFVHGISTGDAIANATGKKAYHTGMNLSLISGEAAHLDGFSLAGIFYEYTGNTKGATIALVQLVGANAEGAQFAMLNKVDGSFLGAQFGDLINIVGEDAEGAQFAGIFNQVQGNVLGAQFGGIGNFVGGGYKGAQFAGITNVTAGEVHGAQFAGIVNLTAGSSDGANFAGITNVNGGDLDGAQFAGILNLSGGTMRGASFAGIANVAPQMDGLTVAPFNVSDTHDGIPIGLVSYVADAGLHYDVWGDETGFVHAGLRSGNKKFYNLLFVGARGGDSARFTFGAGLGYHFDLSPTIGLEVGGLAKGIVDEDLSGNVANVLASINVTGVFDLGPFWLTAGPTLNAYIYDDGMDDDFIPWEITDYENDGRLIKVWPGFNVGLRF